MECEIAEREAQRPRGQPWRYAITLMTDERLEEFRRLVQDGSDPDEAARRAMESNRPLLGLSNMRDAGLDDLDDEPEDDDAPAPPMRRLMPRPMFKFL